MDRYRLQSFYGIGEYRKGEALLKDKKMTPYDLGHGITLYAIGEHEVIIRTYRDDPEPLYDCTCRRDMCEHMAAVDIWMCPPDDTPVHDDDSVIEELKKMTDSIHDRVCSNPDYDEDYNCYEDWEIEKYDIDVHNRGCRI